MPPDSGGVWELTKETVHLPLGCLQGGLAFCTLSVRDALLSKNSLRPLPSSSSLLSLQVLEGP